MATADSYPRTKQILISKQASLAVTDAIGKVSPSSIPLQPPRDWRY